MSIYVQVSPELESQAIELGYGLMSIRPERVASRLQDSLKRAAMFLSKATELSRARCLDCLARAGGFDDWPRLAHHLSRHEAPDWAPDRAWLTALLPSFAAGVRLNRELPPSDSARLLLESYWRSVARECDVIAQRVLDEVGARMLGEKAWSDLLARSPIKAKEPLYWFNSYEPHGDGSFEWSPACRKLVKLLDDKWQGSLNFSHEERDEAMDWVEQCLIEQPDFLEAGLAFAQMLDDTFEDDRAGKFLDVYIEKADALIPEGFKGKLPWGSVDNRFYHRMLWLRVQIFCKFGEKEKAAKLARKMLRLNPDDNIGVRFYLPLLLLEVGNARAALRACKKIQNDTEVSLDAALACAFVEFFAGNVKNFREHFLLALFRFPYMRLYLLAMFKLYGEEDVDDSLGYNDEGINNDIRGIYSEYFIAFETFSVELWAESSELRELVLELLESPAVRSAERNLRLLWEGFWQKPESEHTSTFGQWESGVIKYATSLSSE